MLNGDRTDSGPRGQRDPREVREMAARVRALYIARRRKSSSGYAPGNRWDGGWLWRGGHQIRYEPIWPDVARFVLLNRLDSEAWVSFAFAEHARNRPSFGPPQPNLLMSSAMLDRFREDSNRRPQDAAIGRAFASEQAALRVELQKYVGMPGWTPDQIRGFVLLDPRNGLSPLLRYCVAVSEGMDNLAERLREPALHQLLECPDLYAKHWGAWLPPPILYAARKRCRESAAAAEREEARQRKRNRKADLSEEEEVQ